MEQGDAGLVGHHLVVRIGTVEGRFATQFEDLLLGPRHQCRSLRHLDPALLRQGDELPVGRRVLGDHHPGEFLDLERRALLQRQAAGLDLGDAVRRGPGHELLGADLIGGLCGPGQGKGAEQGEHQDSNAAKHGASSSSEPL
ncbi:hypothetical protein D3C84_739370 [compost metagenome]